MATLTTPRLAIPYPDGNERVMDGDNAMGAIATTLDDLQKAGIPYRISAGSATIAAPGGTANPTVPVSFPAGRFTRSPLVIVTVYGTATYIANITGLTLSGFSAGVFHNTAGTAVPAGSYTVYWIAIQMSLNASDG